MVRDKVPTIVGLPLLSLLAVSLVTVSAVPVTTTTTLPLREESTLAEQRQSWVLRFAIRGTICAPHCAFGTAARSNTTFHAASMVYSKFVESQ
jgi:hypothetical protein